MTTRAFVLYLIIIAIGVFAVWGGPMLQTTPEDKTSRGYGANAEQQRSTGKAAIGGHFELLDISGNTVSEADYLGKPMLVFFGFTHCPDICPVAASNFNAMLEILGEDADKVTPIFISVDPERDTPEVMKNYFANFDSRIQPLTGSRAQIEQAAQAYKVYYQKSEQDIEEPMTHGMGYVVDHSGFIYVMDKNGEYQTHFRYDATPQELADAARKQF